MNDLYNAAVKAMIAFDNMTDNEYIQCKKHISAECAKLEGKGINTFIHDLFEIADKRRSNTK